MNELRDPDRAGPADRPDLPDPSDHPDLPAPPDRSERATEQAERPRLRDFYRDDDGDIFPDGTGVPEPSDTSAGSKDEADQPGDAPGDADGDHGRPDQDGGEYRQPSSERLGEPPEDPSEDLPEELPEELSEELSELEADHPQTGSVLRKLAADTGHPLDLTEALADPRRRADTLAVVRELAAGRVVPDGDLQRYREENPGQGRLFDTTPTETNYNADGTSRKDTYLATCATADPVRRVGALPDSRQRSEVEAYAQRLADQVEPAVMAEVEDLAAELPDSVVSARTKNADDILDKVRRMSSGSDTRPPRDDYHVGDVVDAVGARITAADTDQLGRLLDHVCGTLGVGDGGRVLELDNMYAQPKASNPSYRVIPLLVATEVDETPYTYELQLVSQRASVAADLEHNTIYKPRVDISGAERGEVRRMMTEAAALDQHETRPGDPGDPGDPDETGRTP